MAPCSQSKARPAPVRPAPVWTAPVVQPPVVQPAPVDEEDIDLDDVSETSDEEDTPPAPAKAKAAPTPGANIPGDATTHVAPIIKPVVKSNRALDIDLFFDRGKGKQSVCKYCK